MKISVGRLCDPIYNRPQGIHKSTIRTDNTHFQKIERVQN